MAERVTIERLAEWLKKRNEIVQMELLKPSLAMLDEIDSGLLRLFSERMAVAERIGEWKMFDSVVFDTGRGDHRLDRFVFNNADSLFILHDARRPAARSEKRWLDRLYQAVERTPVIHIVNYAADAGSSGMAGQFALPPDPGSFYRQNGLAAISLQGRYAEAVGRILKGNEYLV